jgi:hypothetical protein
LVIIIIMVIIGNGLTSIGIDNTKKIEIQEGTELFYRIYRYLDIVLSGIFAPLSSVLLSSFIHWIIARISHLNMSFKQLFSMNTYITFITALGILVNGTYYYLFSDRAEKMISNMGSIIEINGLIGRIINNIELFSIWALILTGIGLQKVAGFPKWLAWAVPISSFMLSII